MGDFNAHIGGLLLSDPHIRTSTFSDELCDDLAMRFHTSLHKTPPTFPDIRKNFAGELLIPILQQFDFFLLNGRFPVGSAAAYTAYGYHGALGNVLDLCFVSADLLGFVRDFCVADRKIASCHFPILMLFDLFSDALSSNSASTTAADNFCTAIVRDHSDPGSLLPPPDKYSFNFLQGEERGLAIDSY